MSHSPVSEEDRRRIAEALARGRRIEAVKIYREATGAGLKESKEFVDALERGGAVPASATRSARRPGARSGDLPDGVRRRVLDALARRRKIEAIRIYREATGAGLKESKEAVEAIARDRPAGSRAPETDHGTEASHPHARSSGCGASVIALVLLVAVVIVVVL